MLLLIDDIHLCEATKHVDAIFRTSPWATHVVLAGGHHVGDPYFKDY